MAVTHTLATAADSRPAPAAREFAVGRRAFVDQIDAQATFSSESLCTGTGLGFAAVSLPSNKLLRILDEFTSAWESGKEPDVDEYLNRLEPSDGRGAVELIYREFCLAEVAGRQPQRSQYIARFPDQRESLDRVLALHTVCTPSLLGRLVDSNWESQGLPRAGDVIGPYVLIRELGHGGFARVFLAEQSNLENRLVVVKIASRQTREPWLLARVRHAHIVEIVSHTAVDDGAFQLICMPFWGGATLTAVLGAQRQRDRRPTTGFDLLLALDTVAAPEYPTVHPARPTREILAGLTYDQALAWVAARLAEALDHAFSRDVAHGDVKPSNILLSADGNPMLLDFNLARESSPPNSSAWANDRGGTLAYMAPERLAALAELESTGPESQAPGVNAKRSDVRPVNRTGASAEADARESDDAPHRADIYALGMVLLEALTGREPEQLALPGEPPLNDRATWLKTVASIYAVARVRSARVAIVKAEAARGWRIAPGLRVILDRCLDPRPSGRYRRAWELAEDLDRWRTDRPLAFTAEPFWAQTVPCWFRRHKRRLVVGLAAFSLVIGFTMAGVVLVRSQISLDETARFKLARHWDDAEAYRFQRSSSDWLGDPRQGSVSFVTTEPGNSQFVETALRAIKDYNVLGLANWRNRDDVRALPEPDREDLELWLMEQVYRYCRDLCDRPNSPKDWQRACDDLARLKTPTPLSAFTVLAQQLRLKLGLNYSVSPPGTTDPSPRSNSDARESDSPGFWLNEYLLGVAAECDLDLDVDVVHETAETAHSLGSKSRQSGRDPVLEARRRAADRALGHYLRMLALRPGSYWGHYRAAVACYVLGLFTETADHLECCLKRRPANPALRGQRAACLAWLERFDEAFQECNRALDGTPDTAELYRTRAFIGAASGSKMSLDADVQHFELLSRMVPRANWITSLAPVLAQNDPSAALENQGRSTSVLDFEARFAHRSHDPERFTTSALVNPEEINARSVLASAIRKAGETELADAELAKILILKPDHIPARMLRALNAIESHRFSDALRDLETILTHPGLTGYIRKDPSFLRSFHHATRRLLHSGKTEEARTIARRALDVTIALDPLKHHAVESHYQLARVYAVSSRTDPEFIARAAKELWWVFRVNPSNQSHYAQNSEFDAVRGQLDAELRRKGLIGRVGGASVLEGMERSTTNSGAIRTQPDSSVVSSPLRVPVESGVNSVVR